MLDSVTLLRSAIVAGNAENSYAVTLSCGVASGCMTALDGRTGSQLYAGYGFKLRLGP